MQDEQKNEDSKQGGLGDHNNQVAMIRYDASIVDRALKMASKYMRNRACNNLKSNLFTTCTCLRVIVRSWHISTTTRRRVTTGNTCLLFSH